MDKDFIKNPVKAYGELKAENAQLQAYKDVNEDFKKAWEELKVENEKLTSWLESSERQKKEVCNVIHKKKEQIQTLKYMLFDEKEIPKDKFTMYYRIAQNERRTKSHRDLCTNIVKKYKQTLQEIKAIAENGTKTEDYLLGQRYTDLIDRILDLITKAEK